MPKDVSALRTKSHGPDIDARRSILHRAVSVYALRGYYGTLAEHVATAANATTRVLFNMFGSLSWLYRAVVEHSAENLLGHTQRIHATVSPERMLDELLRLRVTERESFAVLLTAFAGARHVAAFPEPTEKAMVTRYRLAELTGSCLEQYLAKGGNAVLDALQLGLMLDDVTTMCLECWWPMVPNEPPEMVTARLRNTWERTLRRGWPAESSSEQDATARRGLVSRYDLWRLRTMIRTVRGSGDSELERRLRDLERKLNSSRAVDPSEIPCDVVTMKSCVQLRKATANVSTSRRLVFGSSGRHRRHEVSVLEPLGIALLGSRVGSIVRPEGDDQQQEFQIQDLNYQPESAGNPCE